MREAVTGWYLALQRDHWHPAPHKEAFLEAPKATTILERLLRNEMNCTVQMYGEVTVIGYKRLTNS
jgi:hypothetical protein